MNTDIEHTMKQCATCLEYQNTPWQEMALHSEIPCKPLQVIIVDISMVKDKTLLCIVDCYSKFPIAKKVCSLSADDLVQMAKLIFAEY